jgi:T-complex protein 1 subunit alpha
MAHQAPTNLAINGERTSGQDVRTQNVTACMALSNIVKSSLGPVGLDKMLVDSVGDVTVTNDGATILKGLDVEHPAAKILVELAQLQDQEVGDGTTSVVIFAAELLRRANDLVKQKIHPTSVIAGIRLACKEAVKYVNETLAVKVDGLGKQCLVNCARTSLSSKILVTDADFFAEMAVNAALRVKTIDSTGDVKVPLKAINVLKQHGKSARESLLVDGFALNCLPASQQMPKRITKAKIACVDMSFNKFKLGMGISVVINDPKKLEDIRSRENDIAKERIQMILKTGANVILTSKGIDDLALKYFVEAGAMAVRRVKKEDLKRIAKATGATMLLNLVNLEGEESFDPAALGTCEDVVTERYADDEMLLFKGCKNQNSSSIILRGPNSVALEEMDRSLHDVLSIVKRTVESNKVVPGGGCAETALSIYLENFASTLGSREQLAIAQFAEALLVIPKTLALNAALDASDLVAKLRAHHNAAQTNPAQKAYASFGLDLFGGRLRNNLEAGVLEPAMAKVKMLQSASEAAITILRIDDMIKLNPRQRPERDDE